jgi:hypothetical protein
MFLTFFKFRFSTCKLSLLVQSISICLDNFLDSSDLVRFTLFLVCSDVLDLNFSWCYRRNPGLNTMMVNYWGNQLHHLVFSSLTSGFTMEKVQMFRFLCKELM